MIPFFLVLSYDFSLILMCKFLSAFSSTFPTLKKFLYKLLFTLIPIVVIPSPPTLNSPVDDNILISSSMEAIILSEFNRI